MSPVADNPIIVPDRELEEDKKPSASEPPRIRCPFCGWSPRKEDKWFCAWGNEWNTFDTGGVCPACLHQWSETQLPLVRSLVAAFGLVLAIIELDQHATEVYARNGEAHYESDLYPRA